MKRILIAIVIFLPQVGIAAIAVKPAYDDYSYTLINEYLSKKTKRGMLVINPMAISNVELDCKHMNNDYRNQKNDDHGCAIYKNRHHAIIDLWNK